MGRGSPGLKASKWGIEPPCPPPRPAETAASYWHGWSNWQMRPRIRAPHLDAAKEQLCGRFPCTAKGLQKIFAKGRSIQPVPGLTEAWRATTRCLPSIFMTTAPMLPWAFCRLTTSVAGLGTNREEFLRKSRHGLVNALPSPRRSAGFPDSKAAATKINAQNIMG